MLESIKVGDFVDVRGVAVAVDDGLVIRIPGPRAMSQITVVPYVVRGFESRSAEAIAADAVIKSYPAPTRALVKR